MDEETKFHQEQTSQNVAVMTDMQDTITQLRNQLAELKNTRPPSSAVCRVPEFFFKGLHASKIAVALAYNVVVRCRVLRVVSNYWPVTKDNELIVGQFKYAHPLLL